MEPLSDRDNVVLIVTTVENHAQTQREVLLELLHARKLCIFCISKPSIVWQRDATKAGCDAQRLHFIDTVSRCAGVSDCVEVQAPADLTEMNLQYTKALKVHGCDCAFIGNLLHLLNYVPPESLMKFLSVMSLKTRQNNRRLVLLTVWDEKTQPILHEAFPFMDKIIDAR